jgi:NADPH-dependent 2,4-dienoyl-CoA reductase/sulfur reductase-like enzyme
MKFVIIGGDAAGMSAASRAKRHQPDLEVTVLEKTMDVSYSACGMPYNIAEPARDIDDLVVRHASVFREKQGINLLTGHCAERIDPKAKIVSGTDADGGEFSFPYDRLMIATGASAIKPDRPGFDLPGVLVLKNLEDGRRIKQFLNSHPVRKVVILGMGYIALEMVETLRGLGMDVDMVKPRPRLLPWMEESMAEVVRKALEKNGVTLQLGSDVQRIEQNGGRLTVVCSGKDLVCDMVLVAVGVQPNSALAEASGLALSVDRSIAVDRRLKTSDDSIYSAGDCADAYHVVTGGKTWIPLALRANRAGWAVADNICGTPTELQGVAGTAVFRTLDLEVARTGLSTAEAAAAGFDPAQVVIKTQSRAHAHPGASEIWVQMVGDKKTGRLLGAQMVGREGAAQRINAPAVALLARMTVAEYTQSDLAYAPPFGPTWDPTLTAANQLLKKVSA